MRKKAYLERNRCSKGRHTLTSLNTFIDATKGYARCCACLDIRREKYLKAARNPADLCRKGLHPWIEANQAIDKHGYVRCRLCIKAARKALYDRGHAVCVVGGCDRKTARDAGGSYICKRHRQNPPAWIARTGLRIVGTRVLEAA